MELSGVLLVEYEKPNLYFLWGRQNRWPRIATSKQTDISRGFIG